MILKEDEDRINRSLDIFKIDIVYDIEKKYVPKSKIKEKIEELNKRFAEPIAKTEKEMSDICYTIKTLQSLLED